MPSLLNSADRDALLARVSRLTPDLAPRFGTMSPHRAVLHLIESLEVPLGDKQAKPAFFLVVWAHRLLLNRLLNQPWPTMKPKPGYVAEPVDPAVWGADVGRLVDLLDRFAQPPATWPSHPQIGRLTGTQWGVYLQRHMDHHLGQFGV
ncbi:MAG: DUF1569 domain-containing protein [Armatimonadetes bacterium]|nr:DUF1569 domain-containing protein [Armatimonadota bacterium]